MTTINISPLLKTDTKSVLSEKLKLTSKKIAPVWPLENFVAVNPYMGLAEMRFERAANLLSKIAGIEMTLPIQYYLDEIEKGKITQEDINAVRQRKGLEKVQDFQRFLAELRREIDNKFQYPELQTVSDVKSALSQKDWNRFVLDRISIWAGAYFDKGQAIWNTSQNKESLFAAWKADASVDRTPKVMGLSGFNKWVKELPDQPIEAAQYALDQLKIPEDCVNLYLHCLLLRIGGWSAFSARIDFENELYGKEGGNVVDFLCILLCWEAGMLSCSKRPKMPEKWANALKILQELRKTEESTDKLKQKLLLQDAFDYSAQRRLIQQFETKQENSKKRTTPTTVKAIFCIDVRSELYRRNLEMVAPSVETLGFAGFFAFPIKYYPVGHNQGNAQCPVLLPTGPVIKEEMPNESTQKQAEKSRSLKRQVDHAWKNFKSGAISCFSFVSPVGLAYLPKLFTDSYGMTRPIPHPSNKGLSKAQQSNKRISLSVGQHMGQATGIPIEGQIKMAKNALKAMSLTEDFSRLILMVGHGSSTVNNPHGTGLDCGACAGQTGEANAKVAAAVLNNDQVREALAEEGIIIPESTVFVAAQHDTTTDEMELFNQDLIPQSHSKDIKELKQWLKEAGHYSRMERAKRMNVAQNKDTDQQIIKRSKDWAQVRPEWGLAGCSSFVVAPRYRTEGLDFGGRSFLHSYEWKKDKGFGVLELIMTAPMVVTSWINLQYYASTVDNKNYGSGNKTLHNIVGGVGVLEGYAGDLRTGLPWQSVHDGEKFQNEPLKLNVIIEAPIEEMNKVLAKHNSVKQLCDNNWIHLLAMNNKGKISHRYTGDLKWESIA
ncbi:YbcC family protein [Brumimicrobium oceani]|uniref:Probable inorganic carbon transporter subunit DabA n=1 Tax=Brumimicrobium oceani TaxID=2100725 RepID=A0A2U2XD93_9FLAO|nr:DUF2309 domain-containing protein [Brumimicrobium oceani]PWH85681.1 DUF2309 domain-containing protein [Brumimicrobium oceani]